MKKRVIIIAIAVIIVIAGVVGIVARFSHGQSRQSLNIAELLNLGEKHLTELNYEQALVQFLKVIEIEPMNERAYIGAADAYIGLGLFLLK